MIIKDACCSLQQLHFHIFFYVYCSNEVLIEKEDQGPHIFPGRKYIDTMKAQAGCTHAFILAMGHEHLEEEADSVTLIASSLSVS